MALTIATIIVPVWWGSRSQDRGAVGRRLLCTGGLYFSLIGIGFMLLEMGLIQRLSLYLSHPIYALGIILFSIIASTGAGSYLSELLPLTRKPWLYLFPLAMCAIILAVKFLLSQVVAATIAWDQSLKILLSVLLVAPVGLFLGFFFPTGIRLFKRASQRELALVLGPQRCLRGALVRAGRVHRHLPGRLAELLHIGVLLSYGSAGPRRVRKHYWSARLSTTVNARSSRQFRQ